MSIESDDAVVQVLKEAIQHEHFFDLCDAERLAWMITRAYELGRLASAPQHAARVRRNKHRTCLPKRPISR